MAGKEEEGGDGEVRREGWGLPAASAWWLGCLVAARVGYWIKRGDVFWLRLGQMGANCSQRLKPQTGQSVEAPCPLGTWNPAGSS